MAVPKLSELSALAKQKLGPEWECKEVSTYPRGIRLFRVTNDDSVFDIYVTPESIDEAKALLHRFLLSLEDGHGRGTRSVQV